MSIQFIYCNYVLQEHPVQLIEDPKHIKGSKERCLLQQNANLRGNPLCQATQRHLNNKCLDLALERWLSFLFQILVQLIASMFLAASRAPVRVDIDEPAEHIQVKEESIHSYQ